MPKQQYIIDKFHGGLSNDADVRDIQDDEFQTLTNVVADTVGKLRAMGEFDAWTSTPDWGATITDIHTIAAGYGIHVFNADKDFVSHLILTDSDPSSNISVGQYVGNNSNFTAAAASVGYVWMVTTTYIIVSKRKTGSTAWSTGQDIYYSTDFTDATDDDIILV